MRSRPGFKEGRDGGGIRASCPIMGDRIGWWEREREDDEDAM